MRARDGGNNYGRRVRSRSFCAERYLGQSSHPDRHLFCTLVKPMRTRSVLAQSLDDARRTTDCLFQTVCPDSLYDRTIPERHRIVFYLGHLEAFDWNLIGRYALSLPAFHASFDHLFAFGIDPAAGDLPDDQPSDWPSVTEIEAYNRRTREKIDDV